MAVQKNWQTAHIEGEQTRGFGSLCCQEPLCKIHERKPRQLPQKLDDWQSPDGGLTFISRLPWMFENPQPFRARQADQ